MHTSSFQVGFLATLLIAGLASSSLAQELPSQRLERLAFGSCVHQDLPQPIWSAISKLEPQIFLALGDNIYADTEDMAEMAADYGQQAEVPEFAAFRRSTPILAIWDDHDFGTNDGGADYPKRAEAEQVFLDFWQEPNESPRRGRPGLYGAWHFGPVDQRVQIIMLDGRSFRGPLTHDESPYRRYRPDAASQSTMLGDQQWRWLRQELRRPARLRLVVSGIGVLGYNAGFEAWKNLPAEQERLFDAIREADADGVVFLSGDAHFAVLKRSDGGVGYPLYELTSSGLTHSRPASADRNSPLAVVRPYGGLNFATVDIDWHQEDPVIKLAARDVQGVVVFEQQLRLSELRATRETMD